MEAAADMILRFRATKINELSVNSLKAAGLATPRSGRTIKRAVKRTRGAQALQAAQSSFVVNQA